MALTLGIEPLPERAISLEILLDNSLFFKHSACLLSEVCVQSHVQLYPTIPSV